MKSLVTGGAGFVGKHLVAALTERGDSVRVLDTQSVGADHIVGSVTDPQIAARAVDGVDRVFHLAGNASLWSKDEFIFDEVNRLGTEVMLEASKNANVRKFVQCSSLTTLVGKKTPIDRTSANEETRLKPEDMLGAYPRSKLLADLAVERAAAEGLDAVIAIPTEPIGAGDDNLTPPSRMMIDFLNGRTLAYIDCTLNFVPVSSLADGLIAAAERGKKGRRYILAGDNINLGALLVKLEQETRRKMPTAKLPYWIALFAGVIDTHLVARLTGAPPKAPLTGVRLAGRQVEFNAECARQELGWQATPFDDALKEFLDWALQKSLY